MQCATAPIDPPKVSNIAAMAAPSGGRGAYEPAEIRYSSRLTPRFAWPCLESERLKGEGVGAVIHTGFWGCGAFGNDRTPVLILQTIAARIAQACRLVFHNGTDPEARKPSPLRLRS